MQKADSKPRRRQAPLSLKLVVAGLLLPNMFFIGVLLLLLLSELTSLSFDDVLEPLILLVPASFIAWLIVRRASTRVSIALFALGMAALSLSLLTFYDYFLNGRGSQPVGSPTGVQPSGIVPPPTTYRMIDLTLGQGNAEDMTAAAALGYNLMDVTSASSLSSFPPGTQGVAYIPNCDGATAENQRLVMEYAGQPNFWGFFIFDEPTMKNCPPANMKAVADFIRANAPGAKTYTVLGGYEGSGEYAAALDYVGINPYPCRDGGCDMNLISDYVNEFASNGAPKEKMTPVFQGFSGDGWVLPTAAQMQEMQSIWAQIIPNPQVENTYVWAWSGGQGLRDTPELQAIMKAHNTGQRFRN